MSNFVSALKTEVLRLARKEVRKEIEGLKKSSANHRKEIAELKRRIEALGKGEGRRAAKAVVEAVEGGEKETKLRFSAKGFATHRKKLGISAAEAAELIGVSAQSVYGWETGRSKPRRSQSAAIAAFRKMGKREIKKRLGSAAEKTETAAE